MATNEIANETRETRSFLMARDPSVDRRFRPRPDRQVRLFDEIGEEDGSSCGDGVSSTCDEEESRICESNDSNNSATGHTAQVYLRLRPVRIASAAYKVADTGDVLVVGPSSESTSTSNNKNVMEKHYSFSDIFSSELDQREVYGKCIGHQIEAEESFTMLTYGTSGSGKTFTLLGNENKPGIVPRAVENIFKFYGNNIYEQPALKLVQAEITILNDDLMSKEVCVRGQLLGGNNDSATAEYCCMQQTVQLEHDFQTRDHGDMSVFIWVSFVEIYNESIYDLLEPRPVATQSTMSRRKNLKILSNDGKVFIKGLKSVHVKSSAETLRLLQHGLQNINYAETLVNKNSSRSHCIFFVDILKYYRSGDTAQVSYKFCDLAGSERLGKTGNVGSRLTESKRINTSLLVLGRCLDTANNNRKKNTEVMPYRESKLTMLLQSALLGKERLAMIVTVTPTEAYYEENAAVLRFASIARNIVFKEPAVKLLNSRYSFMRDRTYQSAENDAMNQLLQENIFLRSENQRLKEEMEYRLQEQDHRVRNELIDSFEKTLEQKKLQYQASKQQELDLQKRFHDTEMAALKRKYEEQIEDMEEEMEEKLSSSLSPGGKKRRTIQ